MKTPEKLDLDLALQSAQRAAARGREVLLGYFGNLSVVKEKSQANLVTEADVNSEKEITRVLKADFPHFGILGEESSFKKQNQRLASAKKVGRWIIDPLDGTTNFVHQFPIFCISIGLEFQGEIVVGVIDVPILTQTFYAVKGRGAFMNGKPIHVSDRPRIRDCLLATGFFPQKKKVLEAQIRTFRRVVNQARGVRRPGAAAYDLCMVAQGVFDGFWETDLSPWDTAAGILLVEEAGGKITNFKGKPFNVEMKSIVASNTLIHKKLLALLKSK